MVKKQKKTELKRTFTKRQMSKWQRQQRIQHIIIGIGAFFFAFIIGWIGYGYYNEQVKPLHQTVIRVNDTVFDMDYYIKVLDLISQGQESTAVSFMANTAAGFIAQGELIRQRAADLGASVSTDEINNQLAGLGIPDAKVYRDVVTARLLAAKLLRDYFDPKVPTACEQAKVQAMFLESKEIAEEARVRLAMSDNFTSLAERASREALTKEKKGDLGWLPKGFTGDLLEELGSSKLEEIAFSLELGMISEPTYDDSVDKGMGYWILKVTEKDEAKGLHVWGILLGTWDEAAEIKAKLESGEDFSTLVSQYSQHLVSKEQGGDLGWTRGGEFRNRILAGFAEQLEPGAISKPVTDESVQTKGGYWLIKVEERDTDRQLEDEVRQTLVFKLFQDWVNELEKNSLMENYLTEEEKAWAVARVLKNRGQ
ncbi:MAG: hypothetical protein FJ006_03185 [Chloroflexi bacterium]|nr:hypothetical protein [Chloroflexota bacterium]